MTENTKKIAVMHCRKVGRDCTGSGCFKAFYERRASFACYEDQDAQIVAFFDCCGCDADKHSDPDFLKKLNRLKELEISCLHIAICCTHKCEQLNEITAELDRMEIPYILGTH